MIFGLQDSLNTDERITSAISLEETELYSWQQENFFMNIQVDLLLARMVTFSLCRELRYFNERREQSLFSNVSLADTSNFVINEDLQTQSVLYNLAFKKGYEDIPEEISKLFSRTYESGDILIQENDLSDEIFILLEGTVEVIKSNKVICAMGAGEIFGEMSHFENKRRTATIRATSKLKVLVLEPKNFNVLYQLDPKWSANLIKSLCSRIKNAYLLI